jgi:hypothetical protein
MAITVADTASVQAVILGRRVITALLIVAVAHHPFFCPLATIRTGKSAWTLGPPVIPREDRLRLRPTEATYCRPKARLRWLALVHLSRTRVVRGPTKNFGDFVENPWEVGGTAP